MKILEYDEVDEQQVLEMNLRCFGWFFTSEQVRKIRKLDGCVSDYFALYAVEQEKVLSQVGVSTVNTRSANGIEKIGYIWGVCTRPNAARKGMASRLMEEAHSRLVTDEIRYSFLGTGKSLVAYALYRELGYKDFQDLCWGVKGCKPASGSKTEITYSSTTTEETIAEMFSKYSKDLLGFVNRPKNFVQVKKAWGWPSINMIGIFQEDHKPIGYLLASREGKYIRIRELCCPKIDDTHRCIESLEMKFKPDYMSYEWRAGTYGVEAFARSGFRHLPDSWGVLMVKDLKGKHSISQIRKLYGIEEDKFHMTSIDEY